MHHANHSDTRTSIRSFGAGQRPSWWRGLVGVIVAACAVTGSVAPALAAPGGDATIEETFTVPTTTGNADTGSVGFATCPTGARVVGGGVHNTDPNGGGVVTVSGPVGETGTTKSTVDGDIARHWYAAAFAKGGAQTFKVFVLCSANSDATIEETTIYLNPGERAGAVATCPAGRRVVGGGIGASGNTFDDYLQVSGPLDETGLTANTADGDIARSWYANVFNLSAAPAPYKVFALCSTNSDATIEETTIADAYPTLATCPAGRRVVGGGIGTTASMVDSVVFGSGPVDETGTAAATIDGDIARSWSADALSLNGPQTYKVFALCATSDPEVGPQIPPAPGPPPPSPPAAVPAAAVPPPPGPLPLVHTPTVPVVSGLAIRPRTAPAKRSPPSITTRDGSTVSYTLTAPAIVRFAILAARSGRRAGASCVKPTRSNGRERSCTRYVALPGSFTHQGQAGTNSFSFSGRLAGRALAIGKYRLIAAMANTTSTALAPFRIVNTTGRS